MDVRSRLVPASTWRGLFSPETPWGEGDGKAICVGLGGKGGAGGVLEVGVGICDLNGDFDTRLLFPVLLISGRAPPAT